MIRFTLLMALVILLTILADLQQAQAQSGSRNLYRPTPRRNTVSPEQQQLLQRQNLLAQQANAAQQRIAALRQLSLNPNSKENRNQYREAYNDAKAEFMAIRKGTVNVSGQRLQRPFVLRSNEINRKARKIRWPKSLREEQHQDVVNNIEKFIANMEKNAQELSGLIRDLGFQLEQRVLDRSIDIKSYASSKRFLSGLANEVEL